MNETVGVVRERERESNRLEKRALICYARKWNKYIICKDRYA